MSRNKDRLTGLEKAFIKAMSAPKTVEQASLEAGYLSRQSGYAAMRKPIVQEAVRAEVQKLLREKYGPAAVHEVANMAFDTQTPAGTRLKALERLAEWSGIAGDDDAESGKDLADMTWQELKALGDRKERELNNLRRVTSDKARPVIEAEPAPESDVFG